MSLSGVQPSRGTAAVFRMKSKLLIVATACLVRPQPLSTLCCQLLSPPGSLLVLKCSRHSPASGPLQVLFPLLLLPPVLSSSQGWPLLSISSSTRRPFLTPIVTTHHPSPNHCCLASLPLKNVCSVSEGGGRPGLGSHLSLEPGTQ